MAPILLQSPFQLTVRDPIGSPPAQRERYLLPIPMMKIEAHIEHGPLARLLNELAPVRIHMTPPEEGTRWLELEKPSLVQAVPGRGLRVHAAGRFRFDLWRLPVRFGIRRVGMILEPVVVEREGSPRLAFAIELEEGDLIGVPAFVERPLVRKLNAVLQPRNTKLVWGFADTLTQTFDMPHRLEPLDALSLATTQGAVFVDREAIHLSVELRPELHRTALADPASASEGDAAAPASAETLDPRLLLAAAR